MSVIPIPGARPDPDVTTEIAHEALTPRFAHAADLLAGKAGMSKSGAEAKDFADAALKCVQAIITLDPTRLQGGDTPIARKSAIPEPPRPGAGVQGPPSTKDADADGRIAE